MPQGHNPTRGSQGAGAGSASKPATHGVLTRVFGNMRGPSRHVTNKDADTDWVQNYQITHSPDRPKQDTREGLRPRDSKEVLEQLMQIWDLNEAQTKAKRAARAARRTASTRSLGPKSRRGERARQVHGHNYSASCDNKPRRRESGRQATAGRRANNAPPTISTQKANAAPNSVETPMTSWPTVPSSSKAQANVSPKQSTRPLNHPPQISERLLPSQPQTKKQLPPPVAQFPSPPAPPAPPTRESMRPRAMHESMVTPHSNTDPTTLTELIQSTSPRFAPPNFSTSPIRPKKRTASKSSRPEPKCPLCRNPLRTTTDMAQNLCADCRVVPRQSTFASPHPSTRAYSSSSYSSLISEIPEVPEMTDHVDVAVRALDKIRHTEVTPRKRKSRNNVSGEAFRLQDVPPYRKYARAPTGFSRAPTPMPKVSAPASSSQEVLGEILLPKVYVPEPSDSKQSTTRQGQASSGPRVVNEAAMRQQGQTTRHRANASLPINILPKSPVQGMHKHQSVPHYPSLEDLSAKPEPLRIIKAAQTRPAEPPVQQNVNVKKVYRDTRSEIDSIIDCYRYLGEKADVNAKGKYDFAASYHTQTSHDLSKRSEGFI